MISRRNCSSVTGQLVHYMRDGKSCYLLTRNFGSVHVKGQPCDRFGRVDPKQDEVSISQTDVTPVVDLAQQGNRILFQKLGERHDNLVRQKSEALKTLASIDQGLAELEQEYKKVKPIA